MIVQAVLIFLVSVIFYFALKIDVWGSKAPPHPPLQPIVGNLLMMQKLDSIIHFAFHSLSKSFGNAFRLRLGLKWNLVLTGYEEIKVNFKICQKISIFDLDISRKCVALRVLLIEGDLKLSCL